MAELREASPEDEALFEKLRAVRKRLADAEGVPAYIVFSDAALRGMAARRPHSEGELLQVPGVGPVKLERYGAAFLAALREG
jgi:ATP-dependent DNA helicase RecQ